MRLVGAILIAAGGIAFAWWYEDPFIRRDATFQRLLRGQGVPDCKH